MFVLELTEGLHKTFSHLCFRNILFSFQYKHTDFFHPYGKYQEHHQALSFSVLVCCSSPGHIANSHSNSPIPICQTPLLLQDSTSLHRLVPLCMRGCPFLICLWNLYEFLSPAQGFPFLSHPQDVSGSFSRPAAPLCFLRMPSMGNIFTCTIIFFSLEPHDVHVSQSLRCHPRFIGHMLVKLIKVNDLSKAVQPTGRTSARTQALKCLGLALSEIEAPSFLQIFSSGPLLPPLPHICYQYATEALIKYILPLLIQFLPNIAWGLTFIFISLKLVSQFKLEVKHTALGSHKAWSWIPICPLTKCVPLANM